MPSNIQRTYQSEEELQPTRDIQKNIHSVYILLYPSICAHSKLQRGEVPRPTDWKCYSWFFRPSWDGWVAWGHRTINRTMLTKRLSDMTQFPRESAYRKRLGSHRMNSGPHHSYILAFWLYTPTSLIWFTSFLGEISESILILSFPHPIPYLQCINISSSFFKYVFNPFVSFHLLSPGPSRPTLSLWILQCLSNWCSDLADLQSWLQTVQNKCQALHHKVPWAWSSPCLSLQSTVCRSALAVYIPASLFLSNMSGNFPFQLLPTPGTYFPYSHIGCFLSFGGSA